MALTMTPIMRQPFANLDTPRVRSLMRSHLNRQPAKRTPLGDLALDAENVDPTRNASKRKRGADDDEDVKPTLKPSKTSRIALSTIPKTTTPTPTPITTPIKTTTTPAKPILKPAGRSPVKSTPRSASHRRSNVSKRPDQRSRVTRPFSLAAALAGPQGKPASKKSTPASWSFDIHVDSEQEEMTNLMQHSTTVLDIGCDDSTTTSAANAPSDARGKENIPPAELGLDVPVSAPAREHTPPSRKDAMEDTRAPLGDLPAADYYGEDCHAFSYAVVYEDDDDDHVPQEKEEKKKPARSKLSSVSSVASNVDSAPEEEKKTNAADENKPDTAATGAAEADS